MADESGWSRIRDRLPGRRSQRSPATPARQPREPAPTPIIISPRTRTLIVVAVIVLFLLLCWYAPIIVNLLLGGATLALVLSFPVRSLSRVMPRPFAILAVFLGLLFSLAVGLFILVPLVIQELTELVDAAPGMSVTAELRLRDYLQQLYDRGVLPSDPDQVLDQVRQGLFDRVETIADQLISTLVGAISGAFGIGIQIFGLFFVAIYLLIDINRFRVIYMRMTPRRYRRDAAALWDDIGYSLSRYLGGLLISLTIQGVMAAIALWIIGVPYAVLLGLWTSVTAILPYIGAFLGAIPALILALTISPETAVITAIIYVVINQIEGNLLTPRIQGQAVQVHPLLVFLTVIAGTEIAGIRGAIFAVPTLAVIRVLVKFFLDRLQVQPSPNAGARTPEPTQTLAPAHSTDEPPQHEP